MVSIVVPLYNAEKYISKTLDSFTQQTYQDWEAIVVDDGSKDNSANIVKEYSQKDHRIKYIYQENAGVSKARNNGISHANGDFISFCDADDTWYPENLEKRLDYMNKNHLDWCFSNLTLVNESGEIIGNTNVTPSNFLEDALSWNGNVITTPSTITVKKKVTNNIQFDAQFSTAADQDFFIRIAAGFKGGHINEELVYYRVLSNSMSRNIAVMEKDHIGVFEKVRKNKLFHSKSFEKQCFANLYFIIGASWWKDGHNKLKGTKYMLKSFFTSSSFFLKRIRK